MRPFRRTPGLATFLPALGLLGVLLLAPRDARANSGKSFLETIGISIAMGTVLGASTLPFYDQPGKHLSNLAYGAAAGAGAGLIYAIYTAGRSTSDQTSSGDSSQFPVADVPVLPNTGPRFWMPLVSLNL